MTSNITFRFAGDVTPLKRATKSATGELSKFGSKMKSSFSPANLLGPVAAAASFGAITDAIGKATKAYFEDAKSVAILNGLIDNNTEATGTQKKALEESIAKMSLMSAVADDDLRASMSKLVVATKDVTVAQDLLQLALDVSAGTGKDLGSVSAALSKAYNGNFTSLQKLVPGVQKGEAAFDDLRKSFAGAAATAGSNDPFAQMSIVMEELNEQLGEKFAPLMKEFMSWLQGPEGTAALKELGYAIDGIGVAFEGLSDFFESDAGKLTKQVGEFVAMTTPLAQVFTFFSTMGKQAENENYLTKKLVEYTSGVEDRKLSLKKTLGVIPEIEQEFQKKVATIPERIKNAAERIRDAGEQFKKSINFGDYIDEKTGVFDAGKFMAKFRGIVAAAKALPAKLKQLQKAGASSEVLQQVLAMGPEQGLAVAEGFLSQTGSVASYSKSLGALSTLGQKSAAATMTQNTYEINVTKANMTAEEIIAVIQKYERKTGKKVALGG